MMNTDDKKRKTGMARLIQIAGTKRWLLFASMTLAVITAIAQFVPFVSIYNILIRLANHATNPSLIDKDAIWFWSYVALIAFVAFGVMMFAAIMLSHIAAFNILYELRMKLAQKLVRLPMGFFSNRSSGDIKKTMSEDVERIELFIAHHIPDIISAIVFPMILIGYMFAVDWRMTLALLIVLIVSFFIMSRMYGNKAIKEVSNRYVEIMGKMNGSLVEYIRGIQVVKTFNRSTKSYEQLNTDIRNYRSYAADVNKQYMPTYVAFQTVLSSALLVIIPFSTILLINAPSYADYVPKVLMFLIFGVGIFFPVLKLMWIGAFLNQNTMGIAKIDEILFMPEIEEPNEAQTPQKASIKFSNVSFAYDNQISVLKEVSFVAESGTVTALVGPSGAGKTTVAMLAARFWDVCGGEIRIGDIPVKQISSAKLMESIAFVFQDNMLFFDTIEENIRMGNKTASFEEVVKAARAAQCHHFIESLTNGYQTLVGEGGTYLSGGEQQRVALARAVLKDAPIVLLDEATAFADPENEGKILETFSHLIKGKTVLVIAHRLGTITNADQILYIDKGTIAECGTHQELLSLNKEYARMWKTYSRARNWALAV